MSQADTETHVKATVFNSEEVKALWFHFMTITAFTEFIEKQKFQAAMLFKDSAFLDRMFRVFDTNEDDKISFTEYISCLSFLSNKSQKSEKIKFSFQIYDFDGDGFISKTDLRSVVAASLREHNIVITRKDIDHVVDKTMTEIGPKHEDMISLDEYKIMVEKNPHMLAQLTLNISSIVAEYSSASYTALKEPRGFHSALNVHNNAVAK